MYSYFAVTLAAYLAGSIPFGKLIGRLYGVDIQAKGSGNIGFANVRRVLGWPAGLLVLAADMLKGYLPAAAAVYWLHWPAGWIMAVAGLSIVGHIYPVWLKFSGGKGVATAIGTALAISWPAGLVAGLIYIVGAAALKKSAIGSLAAVWALPWLMLAFTAKYVWFYVAVAVLITYTHRSNIKQILNKRKHGAT